MKHHLTAAAAAFVFAMTAASHAQACHVNADGTIVCEIR